MPWLTPARRALLAAQTGDRTGFSIADPDDLAECYCVERLYPEN